MARALQYVEIAQEHRKLLVATAHLESPLPNRCTKEVRVSQLAEGLGTKACEIMWYAQEENSCGFLLGLVCWTKSCVFATRSCHHSDSFESLR